MGCIINVSIIENYDNLPILLSCVMDYTNYVHILRTFTERITWTTKKVKRVIRKEGLCSN